MNKESQSQQAVGYSLSLQLGRTSENNRSKLRGIRPNWSNKYSSGLLDFHTHSTASDGSLTPTELVKHAKKQGISAMALTDHNTISGLEEFHAACKTEDVFPIPLGVEIYASLPLELIQEGDNRAPDLVMLGKKVCPEPFIEYEKKLLKYFREVFLFQTLRGLESVGFKFPNESVRQQYEILERELQSPPKIFHEFLNFPGNREVFLKYLQNLGVKKEEIPGREISWMNKYLYAIGRPAYVDRISGFDVADALTLAKDMNARLFVAHPGGKVFGALRQEIIDYYIKAGIHGIEVRNYFNSVEQNEHFDKLTRMHGLLRSGGSDYHGTNGASKVGIWDVPENRVPNEILEELVDGLPN